MALITRRNMLALASGTLAAATLPGKVLAATDPSSDDPYALPALNVKDFPAKVRRTVVPYKSKQYPGTIIIDTSAHHLYVILEGGLAIRYGVAVGKDGFRWAGVADVARKVMWPKWTPPPEMIERKPELGKWKNGMPGGPENPLGARALYLYRDGRDTLYRIHGTNDPKSIGTNSSSGCIRMFNQDIVELYRRTPVGARVLVYSEGL